MSGGRSNNIEIVTKRDSDAAGKSSNRDRSPVRGNNDSSNGNRNSSDTADKRTGNRGAPRAPRGRGPHDSDGFDQRRVHVSNIPYDFRWQNLKDLFRKEVGEVMHVQLFTEEDGTSKGSAVMAFRTQEVANKAIEKMHRHEINGRNIVVKMDSGVERDRSGRTLRNGGMGGGPMPPGDFMRGPPMPRPGPPMRRFPGPGPPGLGRMEPPMPRMMPPQRSQPPMEPRQIPNTYGLSMAFLENIGIDGPLVDRVFVANLDYKVDQDKLKEVFGLAGNVVSVNIREDKDGKSKGHGTVQFSHPVEAVQAISMLNNQNYMDRRITVRMDRVSEKEPQSSGPSLPAGLKSLGAGLGTDGAALTDVLTRMKGSETGNQPAAAAPPPAAPINSFQPSAAMTGMGMSMGGVGDFSSGVASASPAGLGLMGMAPTAASAESLSLGMAGMPGSANAASLAAAAALQGAGMSGVGMSGLAGLGAAGGAAGLMAAAAQYRVPSMHRPPPSSPADLGLGATGLRSSDSVSHALPFGAHIANTQQPGPAHFGAATAAGFGGAGFGSAAGVLGAAPPNRMETRSIIVSNLDQGCTFKRLRDKYNEIGDVSYVEMKGVGVAVVHFDKSRDAMRAIAMTNGYRLDGRMLDVRPY